MALILLLVFGLLVAAWWAVGLVADLMTGRHRLLPDRIAVRVLPGHLPAYVREDYARARRRRPARPHAE